LRLAGIEVPGFQMPPMQGSGGSKSGRAQAAAPGDQVVKDLINQQIIYLSEDYLWLVRLVNEKAWSC